MPVDESQRNWILAIESTCDETAAAAILDDRSVVASLIATQEALHQRFEGVVPEIAARAHLERMVPVIDQVLREASLHRERLQAIAVANEPGLPGSLVVGLAAAKALCLAWNKPLVTIDHIQAHLYACQMATSENLYPNVGLVVSGGHTHLYHCHSPVHWELLGGTIDDAAGEAFDKVAVMLGLPFPGGSHLAQLAHSGDPKAFDLPRPMLQDPHSLDFSFSGLKTAVRYQLVGPGKQDFDQVDVPPGKRADVAASFQQAVVDCIVEKSLRALRRTGLKTLCVGGGVAANRSLRDQLTKACQRRRISLHLAPRPWCTDNAAMGAIAWEKLERSQFSPLDVDITPGLRRG
ncbi:MAG: tRNA (adenosine(37)-N6)-threonylcarbamoyltransferase complex transferase subunit TsaD [Pirellulaceae bacterium]